MKYVVASFLLIVNLYAQNLRVDFDLACQAKREDIKSEYMDIVQKDLDIVWKHFKNKKIINGLETIDICDNIKCNKLEKKHKIIIPNADLKFAYETFMAKFPINTLTKNNWLLATKFPEQDSQYNEQRTYREIEVCYIYENEKTLWISPIFGESIQFIVFKQVDNNAEITLLYYPNTD